MKIQNDLSIYELLGNNDFPVEDFFYIGLSSNDVFQFQQSINLQLHRPRYALVYNNIIEDSIVDNSYYKILKTIYFEDSEVSGKLSLTKMMNTKRTKAMWERHFLSDGINNSTRRAKYILQSTDCWS